MDKVYQVFVSSTYSDLKDERRSVSETLAKAGYIPAGMELFPATDQQQLEFIKRVIDRCDYYVVIVGGRYGSLADDKISFTDKEYEYAVRKKIPILAFLHAKPDRIEVGKTDRDAEQTIKLAEFRSKLSKERIIDFWETPQDLCTKVVIAVTQAINLSPGVGWVRGDQAVDPKVLQDVERLRIENEQLRQRLAELDGTKLVFPEDLIGPDDPLVFSVFEKGKLAGTAEILVKDLLHAYSRCWCDKNFEFEIKLELGKLWAVEANKLKPYKSSDFIVGDQDIKIIRSHLEALGLIELTRQVREYKDFMGPQKEVYVAWSVTDKGRRYMASLLAVRRDTHKNDISKSSPNGT